MSTARYSGGSWLPQTANLRLVVWVDGASMPNPGPSGTGLLVLARGDGQDWLFGWMASLGFAGNNQAEFAGLSRALDLVRAVKPAQALILSDSMVGLRLVTGAQPATAATHRSQQQRTATWLGASRTTSLCWVPRNRNLAHHLAQSAAQLPAGTESVTELGDVRRALARAS